MRTWSSKWEREVSPVAHLGVRNLWCEKRLKKLQQCWWYQMAQHDLRLCQLAALMTGSVRVLDIVTAGCSGGHYFCLCHTVVFTRPCHVVKSPRCVATSPCGHSCKHAVDYLLAAPLPFKDVLLFPVVSAVQNGDSDPSLDLNRVFSNRFRSFRVALSWDCLGSGLVCLRHPPALSL